MLIRNLLYILQSENYNYLRFLKFVYTHYQWWNLEKRQKIKWTAKTFLLYFLILAILLILLISAFICLGIYGLIIFLLISILMLPFVVCLALGIIFPIDVFMKKIISEKAKKILKEKRSKGLTVIGITGSFGKTSTKEILYSILREKFEVIKTPGNVNTETGVANFIIKNLSNEKIFIVEMGADKAGDIKDLCNLIEPDYSILTGIGFSHLERFANHSILIKEKFILPERTKKISVLNADNEIIVKHKDKFKISNSVYVSKSLASNIKIKENFQGLEFTYEDLNLETQLLGLHNVMLIIMCIRIAREFGVSDEEIKNGLKKLKPATHRLEPIYNNVSNIWVIDDSYNGNFDGIKSGIEVLSGAKGRKVVITPGIVELGEQAKLIHNEIGRLYAKNVDLVLLIKNPNSNFIIEGMKEEGFQNYMVYASTEAAHSDLKNVLKGGDAVIFQNDLTDNYF